VSLHRAKIAGDFVTRRHVEDGRICPEILLLSALFSASGCFGSREGPLVASGTIEAIEVDVSPEVSGKLTLLKVMEGVPVEKGQTLAEIDPEPYDLALRQAEAALRQGGANYARLARGYRSEEVEEAKKGAEEREAQLTNARANFSRAERLQAGAVASQENLDAARRDVDVATAQLQQARERLALLQRGFRAEEIEGARAERDRLQAILEQRQRDRDKTRVASPLRGMVTARVLEEGEYARIGSPIVRVADLAHLYCWVYLSESEVGRARIGDAVKVRIDAYPRRDFPGTLAYVSPEAEFTPKNIQTREERVKLVFAVKVLVDNPDGALKIGLPADVVIPVRGPSVPAASSPLPPAPTSPGLSPSRKP